MKRCWNWKIFLIGVITFSQCLLYNACERTDSGLPDPTHSPSTIIGNPLTPKSLKILDSLCRTLQRCHPQVSYEACASEVKSNSINMQIGAATTFNELSSVAQAEQAGLLKANAASADSCASAIDLLNCEDPLVLASYNSQLKQAFSGANNVIPLNASCTNIFSSNIISEAKNYHYIRAGAKGTGDGSDWDNACPDFSGPCAGSNMIRGDTYFVASGNYSFVSFSAAGDATITVKKATSSDHGTGQGWQQSFGVGAAAFPGWEFASNHWLLDGNGFTSPTSGHGFQINLPALNPSCPKQFCNAIYLNRTADLDDIRMRFTEILGFGNSGSLRYLTGIYSGLGDGNASNITFSYGYMHDFGDGGISFLVAGNGIQAWTFENSMVERISGEVLSDQGSQNITIRYNVFKDVGRTAVIVSENSNSSPVETKNMAIYGNIFWESDPSTYGTSNGVIACINGNICSNWLITNNTIAGFKGTASLSGRVRFDDASSLSKGNLLQNNIWFDSIEVASTADSLQSDHNTYILTTGTPTESNSEIESTNPFLNSSIGDFHLKSPTAPGVLLPAPFNFDLDGKLRGQNGIWNRGAYQ
ncbi:MAG: right-handed parallel beta-helix repeat-containing protein [Pseudobdellovibrionaceae bacterium]